MWRRSAAAVAAAALVLAGCGGTSDDEAILDLETLEAESDFGIFEAERAEDSYVGAIGEGQAIGITSLEGAQGGEARALEPGGEVVVYLYEDGETALMMCDVDAEGRAELESAELSDFEASVELVLEDDLISGAVTFRDEEPAAFTATEAAGVSGVYWATGTDIEEEVSADWVVLPDERQWGCVCGPPFKNPCCPLGRF